MRKQLIIVIIFLKGGCDRRLRSHISFFKSASGKFYQGKTFAASYYFHERFIEGKDGDLVKVAGLVLVRQRRGTAKGVCFITTEDETGVANLVVFRNLFDSQYRNEILHSKLLRVQGKLQIEAQMIHVM